MKVVPDWDLEDGIPKRREDPFEKIMKEKQKYKGNDHPILQIIERIGDILTKK